MKKIDNVAFKSDELKQIAKFLLENGFYVAISNYKWGTGKTEYLICGNSGGVCMVNLKGYFGVCLIGTIHKPHKNVGTGFVMGDVTFPLDKKQFEEAINMGVPEWGVQYMKDSETVTKYSSIDEYLSKKYPNPDDYVILE